MHNDAFFKAECLCRFAEFTEQIEVDSAITSDGFVYDPPTPDYVKCKIRVFIFTNFPKLTFNSNWLEETPKLRVQLQYLLLELTHMHILSLTNSFQLMPESER